MANKIGSENYSMEFRDLQATTMSLDSTGQYSLLAGRKYLGILDLAVSQGDLLVRIPYGGKYEISSTQWSSSNLATVLAVAVS
ncbi:unnamed protein product [Allacma fusca]|uniref:Uncharacterized protein n=1 Tax=Allacma fusca TaxID=39272 RepID=A0A8J2KY46_9HEXA|nr:unnamed protein product [Allacma fusca]